MQYKLSKNNCKGFISSYGILLALGILLVLISVLNNSFWTIRNLINILRITSINGLLAVGMTFVVLIGGIDLSVGAIMGTSGMISALLAQESMGIPIVIAVAAGMCVGIIIGLVNGAAVTFLNVPAFVATLGTMSIAEGVTYMISDAKPITKLSDAFKIIGSGSLLQLPIPFWIFMLVAICSFCLLYKYPFGRYVFSLGGNEEATYAAGVNIKKIRLVVFVISGMLAALAGVIMTARVSSGVVTTGNGYETDAIAAVVIGGTSLSGGRGRLWGSIVGVLVLTILTNILDMLSVNAYLQLVFKGLIIIFAVLLDSLSNRKI